MKGTFVLLKIRGAQTISDDHIVSLEHFGDHGGSRVGRIGVVTVSHNVYVGIDILEHGAHDIPLALTRLFTHHGSFGRCYLRGTVGGIVVIDVNGRTREGRAKITYHFAYGDLLVVAGEENGDVRDQQVIWHVSQYSAKRKFRAILQYVSLRRLQCASMSAMIRITLPKLSPYTVPLYPMNKGDRM